MEDADDSGNCDDGEDGGDAEGDDRGDAEDGDAAGSEATRLPQPADDKGIGCSVTQS